MIQSMTGFANSTLTLSSPEGYQTHLIMSLKTLNSRYFEINCKLPPLLLHLETNIIKIVKEKLQRGNVFLTVSMSNQGIFQAHVEPSIPVVKSYLTAFARIQKECHIPGTITIADILRLHNTVFTIEQKECDSETEHAIIAAVEKLADTVVSERSIEGNILHHDMQKRHDIIKNNMLAIEKTAYTFLEQKKQDIAQKIAALEGENPEFIQARKNAFHVELDKIDIHEEIVRFNAHLDNLTTILTSDEQEKGRRLNFILQELGREINTLSAKCSEVSIGNMAITIKVELEKIREQAQNIL